MTIPASVPTTDLGFDSGRVLGAIHPAAVRASQVVCVCSAPALAGTRASIDSESLAANPAHHQGNGVRIGASLFFSRKTRNLAGSVRLVLRPTVWMSSGPS